MFDFQKEVILNNLDSVHQFEDGSGVRIDGMVYKYDLMGDVYRTMPEKGSEAEISLSAADFADGKKQLRIELGLDNDYRGEFGSALFYFRKPIVLDAREALSQDELFAALKKLCAANGNVLKVKEAEAAETLTLVATDKYITVRKAQIVTFGCDEESCNGESMEVETAVKDLEPKANVAEFGTYNYMIHNLRLPTYANLRFGSPAAVEMPMAGTNYVQYSFEYTVDRRLGGLSVAGQKTQSTTVHTFFVPEGAAAAEFEGKLGGKKLNDVSRTHTPAENPEGEEVEHVAPAQE